MLEEIVTDTMTAGPRMEKQYSVDFFAHFLSSLQDHCKSFLDFNQVVEVSGYVCVEIDNTKKERYVLGELVQSCGNVISESYCTKAFTDPAWKLRGINGSKNENKRPRSSEDNDEQPQIKKGSKHSSPEEGDSSDLGLKISSVSSLANISVEEEKIIKMEPDNLVALSQSGACPEGDGTTGPSESSMASSRSEPFPLWHRSDHGGLDLDQILNRGHDESVHLAREEHIAGARGTDMKQLNLSSSPTADGDGDLTVLNNEYFTAQMLAHSRKALDPRHLQAAVGRSVSASTQQSSSQSTERSEPSPSTSRQTSVTDPRVDFLSPGTKSPVTDTEGNLCVLVIDEDLDDVIDVDRVDTDDEDNDILSESSQDVSEFSSQAVAAVLSRRSISDEEKERKKYKSSLKYQRYAVKLFNDYQKSTGEGVQPIQTMHPEKLDEVLSDFYSSLRKANGEEFGSMSLRNVQSHLERYLRDANYPFSLTKDEKFKRSHETLKRKIAEARARAGSRGLPVKLTPLNEVDICLLFESGELGDGCPESLLNAMWFMNSLHLRIKHNSDHYNLRWGDIRLAGGGQGSEVLACLVGRSQGQKVYSDLEDPDQCFVRLYKMYRDKRPAGTTAPGDPFYLSPVRAHCDGEAWFYPDRASIHRLTGMFKKITTGAGLEGKKLL